MPACCAPVQGGTQSCRQQQSSRKSAGHSYNWQHAATEMREVLRERKLESVSEMGRAAAANWSTHRAESGLRAAAPAQSSASQSSVQSCQVAAAPVVGSCGGAAAATGALLRLGTAPQLGRCQAAAAAQALSVAAAGAGGCRPAAPPVFLQRCCCCCCG